MYSIKAKIKNSVPSGVKIRFASGSETESNYDYVEIYILHNGLYRKKTFTGNFSLSELIIPTNSFYVYWHTDYSVTRTGWAIDVVEPYDISGGFDYDRDFSTIASLPNYTVNTLDGTNIRPESAHPYGNQVNQLWLWNTGLGIKRDDHIYIYRDNVVDKTLKLNSPKLELVENSAGSLSFKMPPNNAGYNYITDISTILTVYKNNAEIWEGRVISIKEDFHKNKTITAEGALAYLNDTIQPQKAYTTIMLGDLLQMFLAIHNSRVEEEKKLYFGDFVYAEDWDYNTYKETYTNYETTMKAVADQIVSKSNGYIEIRKNNGSNYIYHTPYSDRPICNQTIEFGKNLLDFSKNYDANSFCTAILPLGEQISSDYGFSTSGIEGVNAYTTIEDVNDGSPYIANAEAVEAFGWIEQTVNFDGITNKGELKQFAEDWLADVQYDQMTLEVSAVDLNYLNVDYEELKLSQYVHVVSRPHGLDRYFPITKISIPMDNPANTTFSMGAATSTGITSRTINKISAAEDKVKEIPTIETILYNARMDAGNLVSGFSTGYVTITQRDNGSNELYVTESQIPKNFNADNPTSVDTHGSEILRYWRWNSNGLEYVNKTKNRQHNPVLPDNTPLLALDMEGQINASMILTGSLTANVITAGILKNAGWGKGNNRFYLNLETGELRMNATELTISGSSVATTALNGMSQSDVVKKITGKSSATDSTAGIYLSGSTLRINASSIVTGTLSANRIYGGTLTLGGSSNGHGTLELLDKNNVQRYLLNYDGLLAYGSGNDKQFYAAYSKQGSITIKKSTSNSSTQTINITNCIAYYKKSSATADPDLDEDVAFAYMGVGDKATGETSSYGELVLANLKDNIIMKTTKYLKINSNKLTIDCDGKIDILARDNSGIRIQAGNYNFDGFYRQSDNSMWTFSDDLTIFGRIHIWVYDGYAREMESKDHTMYYRGLDDQTHMLRFENGILIDQY